MKIIRSHIKFLLFWISGILGIIYFFNEDGHLVINSEYAKIYYLKGGYRSYTISYSQGHQLQDNGTIKNLWSIPTLHYLDTRNFKKKVF